MNKTPRCDQLLAMYKIQTKQKETMHAKGRKEGGGGGGWNN